MSESPPRVKTFGTLALVKGKWHLTAEPHVMVRAKRVFARSVQHLSTLIVKDTAEVCRDLDWLMLRFPLVLSKGTRARIRARVREHVRHGERVHEILLAEGSSREFELALPLRDYQKVAAELAYHTRGILLADDMGVGKSASAIGLIVMPGATPALVATPAGIIPWQWQKEINRFAPGLKTHVIKKGTPYELGGLRRGPGGGAESTYPDVIISTYYRLRGWRDHLAGKFRTVVADEIQKLINPDSEISRAFDHIAEGATYRAGLSGTPINNLGAEMYPVIEHLAPGRLGEKDEFLREWCGSVDSRGRASLTDPGAFGTYLRSEGLMLRRTRKDVGRELPGLTKVIHDVEWDEAKLKEIERPAAELARLILSTEKLDKDRMEAEWKFDMLLRQATGVAKAIAVADFVKLAVENGERVLLFGWHRSVYDLWEERLKDYKPAWFTGSESESAKRQSHEAFVGGKTDVLIMSLRAGAGIDGLQKVCRTVVFGELDWSPAAHEQCEGRIDRDGQPEPVVAYYLIADSGSDPVVADVLGVKRQQLEGLRDPDGQRGLARLDKGGAHVKRLAEEFLRRQGTPGRKTDHARAGAPAEGAMTDAL